MKNCVFVLSLLLCLQSLTAQKIIRLADLELINTQRKVHGIMYGTFIQRLASRSGGFPQDMIILNTDTKKYYKFEVKPTFKTAKKNLFCNYIAPGKYRILGYKFTQSQWYGGDIHWEPVAKAPGKVDSMMLPDMLPVLDESNAYHFTIEPGKIHYMGTWNFSERVPAFTNNKDSVTTVIQKKFKKVDFSSALTSVPE
jgi:hypothetical protein